MSRKIYTYIGLLIAYFSITGISLLFRYLYGPQQTNATAIARELLIFFMIGVLCWIIIKKEKLTLASIGLYAEKFNRSLLWALLTIVLCAAGLAASAFMAQALNWPIGNSTAFDLLSPWTITLITIRAGVAEEIFFRGYIIERLSSLTGNVYIAAALSLIPFALFHYSQGYAGILIAFVLGAVLTVMYIWKRDLKANIMAHFFVDFAANVLIPLISGG